MNRDQFLRISVWTDYDTVFYMKSISESLGKVKAIERLLDFRKEMQKALSKYAKGKSNIDGIQVGATRICEQIAKWCRDMYVDLMVKEVLKRKPALINNRQKLKGEIHNTFEVFLREHSY